MPEKRRGMAISPTARPSTSAPTIKTGCRSGGSVRRRLIRRLKGTPRQTRGVGDVWLDAPVIVPPGSGPKGGQAGPRTDSSAFLTSRLANGRRGAGARPSGRHDLQADLEHA